MQVVKWGKKQRQVKVPAGWKFLLNGQKIICGDMFFDDKTHAWKDVNKEDVNGLAGDLVGVVIRNDLYSYACEVDKDPHAVRIVE